MSHPNVVHLESIAPTTTEEGPHRFTRRQLGAPAGSVQLGCSHVTLPPGARSWPRHWHEVNEEAIYVLSGEGVLLLGEARVAVKAGDYAALPVGEAHAHQMRNESDVPLEYLCFSTMIPFEIAGYADSGKLAIFAGAAPGGDKSQRRVSRVIRATDVDYWDGEG
ncbi:MAG: cupin domain-containing protein [Sandaracinaceae bacterium]